MNIVHIAPAWISIPPKNYGGTEVVIYNLIEEQVAQGHSVTLLAPGNTKTSARLVSFLPKALVEDDVPWYAHLKAFYHLQKSVEYIREHTFDIVHMHLSSASDMYLLPLTASLSVPRVMTLHSCFPFDRAGSYIGDADSYYMDWLADVPLVAISEQARKEVPYDLKFLGVIPHGLPMQVFTPTTSEPEPYLAWLGRFVPEKGAHLAIAAAKEVGVPLVLAGIVDRHLPEAVRYFEEEIEPELDGERIKYIGPVNMEQKLDLLSRAKALLNPITWEEPFGMVMLEAMALGCPVISFRRGAAPEVVHHARSGFLVSNLEEMVQSIAHIEELDRAQVRAHVGQHFSVKVMAERYTQAYRRAIATHVRNHWTHPALVTPPIVHLPVSPTLMAKRDDLASAGFPSLTTQFPMAETEAGRMS